MITIIVTPNQVKPLEKIIKNLKTLLIRIIISIITIKEQINILNIRLRSSEIKQNAWRRANNKKKAEAEDRTLGERRSLDPKAEYYINTSGKTGKKDWRAEKKIKDSEIIKKKRGAGVKLKLKGNP